MDTLTMDLVFTVLASCAVLACGVLGIVVLPWKEEHWVLPPVRRTLRAEALREPSHP